MRVRTRLDALPRAIGQPGQQAVVVLITAQYSIVCIFIEPGHSFLEVIAAGQAQTGTAGAVPFRAQSRSRNAVAAFALHKMLRIGAGNALFIRYQRKAAVFVDLELPFQIVLQRHVVAQHEGAWIARRKGKKNLSAVTQQGAPI